MTSTHFSDVEKLANFTSASNLCGNARVITARLRFSTQSEITIKKGNRLRYRSLPAVICSFRNITTSAIDNVKE